MGDTGVNQGGEFYFSLKLRIQNVMGNVNDLNHLKFLAVAVKFLRFELYVPVSGHRVDVLVLVLDISLLRNGGENYAF